ncbi:hypothetical protein Taro_037963 [Colocasia esculenta]|uniref:Uncharacterized protein n=1 Tax=Colocasia esculenta TaxID=4460 RepID=A0A843WKT5_COLES|nr:hypothetical protein [Colocasia esculenta]
MPAQKPAAYRPPHAKSAAAVQVEVSFSGPTANQLFGQSSSEEMSKNALRNKKRREKQREKKVAESSSTTNVG